MRSRGYIDGYLNKVAGGPLDFLLDKLKRKDKQHQKALPHTSRAHIPAAGDPAMGPMGMPTNAQQLDRAMRSDKYKALRDAAIERRITIEDHGLDEFNRRQAVYPIADAAQKPVFESLERQRQALGKPLHRIKPWPRPASEAFKPPTVQPPSHPPTNLPG